MTQEKSLYQIQYNDNTARYINWTKAEWIVVSKLMMDGARIAPLDESIFVLTDIRTIVLVPPEPEPTEEEKAKEEAKIADWDWLSAEEKADLVALGVNVGGIK